MTTHLRRRIGFGLFLLLLLPLGFYEARSLLASSSQRLNPATLQSLVISYQWQLQQRLVQAVSATQLQAPLPPEFSAYWQKDQQTWQGKRRVLHWLKQAALRARTHHPPCFGTQDPALSVHGAADAKAAVLTERASIAIATIGPRDALTGVGRSRTAAPLSTRCIRVIC